MALGKSALGALENNCDFLVFQTVSANFQGGTMVSNAGGARMTPLAAIVILIAMSGGGASAQSNPYRSLENWAKLPEGRTWGAVSAVAVDRNGNVWALERCGGNTCTGSNVAPILKFDPSGKLVKSFGEGTLS